MRANLPEGGRLGIYGFGGSAHLTAQVALARGARVHVMTRSAEAQRLALALGAASAGDADAAPPEPLDSAILFAPVGTLVPPALAALDRGGTLAVAGIHLSDIPSLHYQSHLFEERALQSVTANTRRDGEEFLAEAARIGLRVSAVPYPMARRRRRPPRPARRPGQRGSCAGDVTAATAVSRLNCDPGDEGRISLEQGQRSPESKTPTVPQSIRVKALSQGPWR